MKPNCPPKHKSRNTVQTNWNSLQTLGDLFWYFPLMKTSFVQIKTPKQRNLITNS